MQDGWSALMKAAFCGNNKCVQLLLDRGADVKLCKSKSVPVQCVSAVCDPYVNVMFPAEISFCRPRKVPSLLNCSVH